MSDGEQREKRGKARRRNQPCQGLSSLPRLQPASSLLRPDSFEAKRVSRSRHRERLSYMRHVVAAAGNRISRPTIPTGEDRE